MRRDERERGEKRIGKTSVFSSISRFLDDAILICDSDDELYVLSSHKIRFMWQ